MHTIDSGSGRSSTGGEFELAGGFWPGVAAASMPGDCDSDGDVDLNYFAAFKPCLTGPGGGLLEPDCACFDFD